MTPEKAKKYINKIAEDKNMDPMVIDDIVSFYWKKAREALTTLKHNRIKIDNLGVFEIKEYSLDKEEASLNTQLSYIDTHEMTFVKHTKITEMSKKLEYIADVKEVISKEKERFKEVEKKREEYESSKENI